MAPQPAAGRLRRAIRSGRFWMAVWLTCAVIVLAWGGITFAIGLDSVRNIAAMSVVSLWVAVAACFQSTLAMRKADPDDPT